MTFEADPGKRANPYQAPGARDDGIQFIEVPNAGAAERISERTVEALAGTHTWVRLVAWLAVMVGVSASLGVVARLKQIVELDRTAAWPTLVSTVIAAIYITGGVLLFRYASAIVDFTVSRHSEHLDIALEAQRTFWRFVGISIAVLLMLVLGMIVLLFWGAGAAAAWNMFA